MSLHTIAVNLVLHDLVRAPLHGIITQLRQLTQATVAANQGLSTLMSFGGASLGAAAVGGGALMGLEKIAKAGWDIVKVQKDMAIAGIEATDIQKAYNKAWEVTAKHGNIGAGDAMRMFASARQIYTKGDKPFHEVMDEMGEIFEAASFLKTFQGGKHAHLQDEMFAAMRSGELAGKFDTEGAATHISNLVGMKIAYGQSGHGGFSIKQYLQSQNAAGVSLRMAGDEFKYGMFPAMSQAMSGAGVALMTLWQKFGAGTRMKKDSLAGLDELGLLDKSDMSKFRTNKKGELTGINDMSAFKGHAQFLDNPAKWTHDVFEPALRKMFGNDDARATAFIGKIGGDRNAMKTLVEMMQMWPTLLQDAKNIFQAADEYRKGRGAYEENNLDYQHQRFHEQMKNIFGALGMGAVDPWVATVRKVNDGLTEVAQFLARHPGVGAGLATVLKALGAFFLGVGAVGFVAIGAWLVAATGPIGLVVGGLAALYVVLSKYNMLSWNGMKKGLSDLWDWMFKIGGQKSQNGGIGGREQSGWVVQGWENAKADLAARGRQIAADFSTLGRIAWDGVKNTMARAADVVLDAANSAWHSIGSKMAAAIASIPSMVMGAISAMASGIGAAISGAISSIAGKVRGFFGGGSGSDTGGAGDKGGVIPQSFTPAPSKSGGGSGVQHVYLDGEKVGRLIETRVAAAHQYPTQAPYHDGSAGWTAPDAGTITV